MGWLYSQRIAFPHWPSTDHRTVIASSIVDSSVVLGKVTAYSVWPLEENRGGITKSKLTFPRIVFQGPTWDNLEPSTSMCDRLIGSCLHPKREPKWQNDEDKNSKIGCQEIIIMLWISTTHWESVKVHHLEELSWGLEWNERRSSTVVNFHNYMSLVLSRAVDRRDRLNVSPHANDF